MSKHLSKDLFYDLPSGTQVHPCRLIHRDGTLMWKHALLHLNTVTLPKTQAVEAHIVKTAQRLEELNKWISMDLEPWECFNVKAWLINDHSELSEGISVYFQHLTFDNKFVKEKLTSHVREFETLEERGKHLFFKRC